MTAFLRVYVSTSAQTMVTKQHAAMGRTVWVMTCLLRRPRGRTKPSCPTGPLDPNRPCETGCGWAGEPWGGVMLRAGVRCRVLAQEARDEDAPDTRRKRRFDVTLSVCIAIADAHLGQRGASARCELVLGRGAARTRSGSCG